MSSLPPGIEKIVINDANGGNANSGNTNVGNNAGDSDVPPADDRRPAPYSTVSIVYSAYLHPSGTLFESSVAEKPTRLRLGQRECVRGLELAIQSMHRGETAEFVLSPEHAYGVDGAGERVPPNTAIRFVVHLVDWDDRVDISAQRDGSILKTVSAANAVASSSSADGASERCKMDGRVIIAYKAFAGSSDEPFETHTALQFMIGDDAVWLALERCAMHLTIGETATFECAVLPHLFEEFADTDAGFLQRARTTPPTSTVRFEVTMHNLENMPTPYQCENAAQALEIAAFFKQRGTTLFERGRFARAGKVFCAGAPYASGNGGQFKGAGSQLLAESHKLTIALLLNEAACALKLGDHAEVRRTCEEVLKQDKSNTKALLRMSASALARDELDEAERWCNKVVADGAIDDAAVSRMLCQINAARQQKAKREKAMFGKIFSSS